MNKAIKKASARLAPNACGMNADHRDGLSAERLYHRLSTAVKAFAKYFFILSISILFVISMEIIVNAFKQALA